MKRHAGPAKAGHYVRHYVRHHVRYHVLHFAFAFAAVAAAQSIDPSQTTVWQGVYTDPQAARGQEQYTTHCARCHREDLSGYNSILKGGRFMEKYRETSLDNLFTKTKTTMPRGAPATLSDNAYVDIIAHLLKLNEFPAGTRELAVDELPRVQVVGKEGPQQVPDFSLVRVIACLTQNASDGAWMLTHASDPVRTGNPQPVAGELDTSKGLPLGSGTYRLLISAAYGPQRISGHRVEARGLLIRRPDETRLNITSLETLDSSCEE